MTKRRKHNRAGPSFAHSDPASVSPKLESAESSVIVETMTTSSQAAGEAISFEEVAAIQSETTQQTHNGSDQADALQRIEDDITLLMQVSRNVQRRIIALEKPVTDLALKLERQNISAISSSAPAPKLSEDQNTTSRIIADQRNKLEALQQQLKDVSGKLQRSQREVEIFRARAATAVDKSNRVQNHLSYRIGYAIVHDTKSFRGMVALPYTLWKIHRDWQAQRSQRRPVAAPPQAKSPVPNLVRESAEANQALTSAAPHVDEVPTVALTGKLKVAAICDEFTFHCFAPECDLLQLHAGHWEKQIKDFQPDLLFIESAWRGFGETWAGKVSTVSGELESLVNTARVAQIPIAFWCKEDPVHFQRFLPVARLADAVFTTDIDCISRYQRELKHEQVYLLPFAAQPHLHNPIQNIKRESGFSFAGSYYNKYKQRCQDFAALIDAAKDLGSITIYDRNAERPQPHDFNYPEEYRSYIKGNLPYTQIDKAYKGYDFGITVNTIKHSQTMFARRAFELMASNTIVVSNFSRGIRRFFPNTVVASDNSETVRRELTKILTSPDSLRRYRLQALRVVMHEHTYAHRLSYITDKLKIRIQGAATSPSILAFGIAQNDREARSLISSFHRQNTQNVKFALLGAAKKTENIPESIIYLDSYEELSALSDKFSHVAVFSPDDYYGPEYLADLALGCMFAPNAAAFTKQTFFQGATEADITLNNDGTQYTYVSSIRPFSSMVKRQMLSTLWDREKRSILTNDISCPDALSVDEFGYCRGLGMQEVATSVTKVDVPQSADYDAYTNNILRTAETLDASDDGWEEQKFTYGAATWARHLPKKTPPELTVAYTANKGVSIKSSLPRGTHKYLYLANPLPIEQLPTAEEGSFLASGKGSGDVRLVLVFLDQAGNKISHLMQLIGRLGNLTIPAGASTVRIGLRVSGEASALVQDIEFKAAERRTASIIPRGEVLLVSYQYPDYNDLYRYGFVHSRVLAYRQRGLTVDVIRYRKLGEHSYREYEGIDITDANIASIQAAYTSGAYRHVILHVLSEPELWDCVKQNLDSVSTTIWVHGSEVQPWWRRASNYKTDSERAKARTSSNMRVAMWREVLTTQHKNLQIVFVSKAQATMALNDLGLSALQVGDVRVIGNFINPEKFSYLPKAPEQRKRILSIRPYVSSVYANDLAVKAVLELSNRKVFAELEFLFVGDGPLFEETLAPLKEYSNVRIERGFISQSEIANLHKQYGVFLVPTRMDSQGVSRDEAMASGLVPVTNAVAAIPEFTDTSCAFAVPAEDYRALADSIERLAADPSLFQRMSAAAAARVRRQSNIEETIDKEIGLARRAHVTATPFVEMESHTAKDKRIAIYGDVNLNIMDGSAVWAASTCEVIAGIPNVDTTLFLKTPIERTEVLHSILLPDEKKVRIVEPIDSSRRGLNAEEAVAAIVLRNYEQPFDAVILRGRELCLKAVASPLKGRIWAYLTDIPQQHNELNNASRIELQSIFDGCKYILCQTPQMRAFIREAFPAYEEKLRILPPMIPKIATHAVSRRRFKAGDMLQLAYAGKFAPRWGIREMFATVQNMLKNGSKLHLQLFGDKVHNPPDDPTFQQEVKLRLKNDQWTTWHGSVDRTALFEALQNIDVCWAYRDPEFEQSTRELSTKALEYASLGIPTILTRSSVFEGLFGPTYPLFASSREEAEILLARLLTDEHLHATASQMLMKSIAPYTFDNVRDYLIRQNVL